MQPDAGCHAHACVGMQIETDYPMGRGSCLRKRKHGTQRSKPDRVFRQSLVLLVSLLASPALAEKPRQPNIVFIYCDNLGYGDIEPFGSKKHRTPNLNRMAREGRKFTHFYSASGVCTPSRAALMTGCYPSRVSMDVTDGAVLRPVSKIGLHPQERTIAELLKAHGYATAIFGKWHLGDQPEFLPTRQGFDYFLGIPYSDDMTPRPGTNWPALPLMENEHVIEEPTYRNLLTKRLNEAAVKWIADHHRQPFFLYLAECMPGSTRAPFASPRFAGRSKNGPWGDSIEELDWSVGQVLDALKRHQIDDNTLIIWTSDNGAPRRSPPQGLNLPLGGWGYTTAEGGMRVPCIMRWPRRIPAGTTCDQLCTTMDMFPTFAALAGIDVPSRPPIDGKDIRPLLTGDRATSPHTAFYYYRLEQLQAVRAGDWKLYLAYESRTRDGKTATAKPRLYDVRRDAGETNNVVDQHADVVARLMKHAEQGRAELGDQGIRGAGRRPHGVNDHPTPRIH